MSPAETVPAGRHQQIDVAGLRRWAKGLYGSEAAVELLLAHDIWFHRDDFLAACTGPCEPLGADDPPMWWIDWNAVVAFKGPSSSSAEKILQIAAGLAGTPSTWPLGHLITGLDTTNVELVLDAIAHTAGWHEHQASPSSHPGHHHTVTGQILEDI